MILKTLHNVSSLLDDIIFDDEVITFFERNRETIIDAWVEYPTIEDIRGCMGYSKDMFKEEIAVKVLTYFMTILRGQNKAGDCPVMREIIKKFFMSGLTVEDVFLNCTAFKNVVSHLFDTIGQELPSTLKYNVVLVIDHNLYGVMSVFSEMILEHEKELRIHQRIIEENVLYTRTDLLGVIVEATEAFCELCGYSKKELIGKTHALIKHPGVDESIYKDLWNTITSGQVWKAELPNLNKDGNAFITLTKIVPVFNDANKIIEYMSFRSDITADQLAKVDPLTGLYNRRALDTKFQHLFTNAVINNEPLSIIMGDIDHFKSINDTYGHQQGDGVLRDVAKILLENTRTIDICSRWGGEEFIIILPGSSMEKAFEIAERIRRAIESTTAINTRAVTCSFGVAKKEAGDSIKEIFKRVDENLYVAKKNGRNKTVAS
jgi:diguanylate cyclase (GGDEF)-like protein/PAS domain S-box-containing protein